MNSASHHRRIGSATAILLGSALALAPITVHAEETDGSPSRDIVRFVPSDVDPRGRHVERQLVSADRVTPVPPSQNLRQLIEADRGAAAVVASPRFVPDDNDPRGHHQVPAPSAPPATSAPIDGTESATRSFPGDVDPRGLHGLSRSEQLLYQPRHDAQIGPG